MNKIFKTLALLATVTPSIAMAAIIPVSDVSQLDFTGNFVHAINFDNRAGVTTIGDATFINVSANGSGAPSGVSVSGFNRDLAWSGATNLGTSVANNGLENVVRSIVWSNGLNPGLIDLSVMAGVNYRVQLLFSEGCCNTRRYDINAEGNSTEQVIGTALGGTWVSSSSQGYAVVYDYISTDTTLSINLSRPMVANADTNYHISGITVEAVPEPSLLGLLGLGLFGIGIASKKRTSV